MVRALVVAVASFDVDIAGDEWDPTSTSAKRFLPLPAALPAAHELGRALSQFDGVELVGGKMLENPDLDTVSREWSRLRQDPSAALIVSFTGHGVGVGHTLYLPVVGTDSARLSDTAIDIGQWLNAVEHTEGAIPTLFLLDVCEAGTAAVYQILQRIRDHDRKAWVIAGCAPDEKAFRARFTRAIAAVLNKLRNGRLDISPTQEFVPVETIATEIDRELERQSRPEDLPQSVFRTATFAATSPVPAFFANPGYTADRYERFRHRLDVALLEIAETAVPGLDPVHF